LNYYCFALFPFHEEINCFFLEIWFIFYTFICGNILAKNFIECEMLVPRCLKHKETNLLPHVIDIVMDIDMIALIPEEAGESVPDEAVSCSSDMRACIGVDTCMLKEDILPGTPSIGAKQTTLLKNFPNKCRCEDSSVESKIHIWSCLNNFNDW
jgi:hypothetical protein